MKIESFENGSALAEKVVDFKCRLARETSRLIPPTRRSELAYYAAGHPFLAHGRAKHFVATTPSGEVLGAVTASVDDQLPGDVGLIGLYQSVNDSAVAKALIGAARDYLATAGKRVIQGPVDYSIWYRYRLRTGGFDRASAWGEPDNPDYYAKLWTDCGFGEAWTWRSFDLKKEHVEALLGYARGQTKDAKATFALEAWREPDDAKFRDYHRLTTGSYQGNPLATPIAFDEFASIYGFFLYFLHAFEIRFVVTPDGKRVGVGFGMPDVGTAFRAANGADVAPEAVMKAAATSETFLFHTIAIEAEHRGNNAILFAFRDYLSAVGVTCPNYVGFLVREPKAVYAHFVAPSRHYALFTMNV